MSRPLAWILALALMAAGGGAAAGDPIKIGLMAPLTGAWSSEGQGMQKVVLLLAEQQNAKGGVLGRKIEIVTEDDGGEPGSAVLAAQRLVAAGVVVAIGTYGSAVTEASQAIFDKAKIPQIANGSTAVDLSARGYQAASFAPHRAMTNRDALRRGRCSSKATSALPSFTTARPTPRVWPRRRTGPWTNASWKWCISTR